MIIIDRIIDDIAVCEADGITMDIPLSEIAGDVREGDVLYRNANAERYMIDADETQKRRDMLTERFARIKNRRKN